MTPIFVYKLYPSFELPTYGTSMSSCFDLKFQISINDYVKGYSAFNIPIDTHLESPINSKFNYSVRIQPGDRLLIPTGLVFKCHPEESVLQQFSIRLHARSSMALKRGLTLANSEGVIDIDYQEQVYVPIMNVSNISQSIEVGERICQAELVRNEPIRFEVVDEKPSQHSERSGGFGSTGNI